MRLSGDASPYPISFETTVERKDRYRNPHGRNQKLKRMRFSISATTCA